MVAWWIECEPSYEVRAWLAKAGIALFQKSIEWGKRAERREHFDSTLRRYRLVSEQVKLTEGVSRSLSQFVTTNRTRSELRCSAARLQAPTLFELGARACAGRAAGCVPFVCVCMRACLWSEARDTLTGVVHTALLPANDAAPFFELVRLRPAAGSWHEIRGLRGEAFNAHLLGSHQRTKQPRRVSESIASLC